MSSQRMDRKEFLHPRERGAAVTQLKDNRVAR
jgi:hypothetical protein